MKKYIYVVIGLIVVIFGTFMIFTKFQEYMANYAAKQNQQREFAILKNISTMLSDKELNKQQRQQKYNIADAQITLMCTYKLVYYNNPFAYNEFLYLLQTGNEDGMKEFAKRTAPKALQLEFNHPNSTQDIMRCKQIFGSTIEQLMSGGSLSFMLD